jgi:hypothetical protein
MQIGSAAGSGMHGARGYWRAFALAAVCMAATWCYGPALHAYFVQDDFLLLALARMLHQPLLAFVHDHFPGSLFFRPLGIFVWWLATLLFDDAPRGHYLVNLLLHLGCVLALYRLLQQIRRDAPLNVLWAAVFAVHPVAIGTALWLSDRFDLIATAFSLLAMAAAVAWLQRPRALMLTAVLACLLLAFMGKEIAIVGALATAILIALPTREWPLAARQRWPAAGAVAALAAGWLVYRAAMLTNPQNSLLHADALASMFANGTEAWLRLGFDYFVADPRQATWMIVSIGLGAALLALAIALASRRSDYGCRRGLYGLAAALAILLLLPGPTQAPVVSIFVGPPGAVRDWYEMVIESRLFHISLAALITILMVLTTATPSPPRARFGRIELAVVAGVGLMLIAWIPASHALAHDYARRTREQVAPLQAAHAAIAKLALPPRHCQLYLLDTGSLWGFDGSADAMIKATTPELGRLDHCLVLTERTPWGNFVRSGSIDDYRPLRRLTWHGAPVPWLRLGAFELAYFNLDADIDARAINGAIFLDWRDGAFVDVTGAVRSGARIVRFYNARPDQK